jgi:tetratricopeptide (TPR) repeat protein
MLPNCCCKQVLLILSLLIAGSWPLYADNLEDLEERLSIHSAPDALRLEILLDHAREYLFVDPTRTSESAGEALLLADRQQDARGTAIALRLLGQAQLYSGEHLAAFDHLQRAMAAAAQTSDTHLMSVANRAMGVFYELNVDYDRAVEYYLEARRLATSPGQKHDLALVFNNIGNVLNTQGNHAEAASYFGKAIDLFEQLQDTAMRDNAMVGLGVSYLGTEQLGEARRVLEDVLSRAGDLDWFAYAEASVHLASIHRMEGDYEVAIALYQSIINAAQSDDYLTGLALAHIGLGDTFEAQGRLDDARRVFGAGLELVRDKTMPETEMVLFEHAARLEYQLGNFETAARVQAA